MGKVIKEFGQPNGSAGYGLTRDYYELSDGSLLFTYASGGAELEDSEIRKIILSSRSGRDNSYSFTLEEKKANYILGQKDSSFEKYDRELQLASLEEVLIVGMAFSDIEKIFGKSNSYLESNNLKPYYELADGSFMIFENTDSSENIETKTVGVKIIDKENRVFKLADLSQINNIEN